MPTLDMIKVSHHKHELKWRPDRKLVFECDECKELGCGRCYKCPQRSCNFTLHKECAKPRASLSFPNLKECKSQFFKKSPPKGRPPFCDACGLCINGFFYECTCMRPHYLHPLCSELPSEFSRPGIEKKIRLVKIEKARSKCSKCREWRRPPATNNVQGLVYEYSGGAYSYHVGCLKEAWFENWKKKYFQLDGTHRDANNSIRALQIFAPTVVVVQQERGRSKLRIKDIQDPFIVFLKLTASAILGDPISLICTLISASKPN